MDLQNNLLNQQTNLPYQPIKFVYTQTIGSVLQKFKQIVDPYTWTYQDILQPKILYNNSKIQYYLFHVAPIYNWLRKVDSNILANYINLGQKGGNITVSKPSFNQPKVQQYKKFDNKVFQTEIKHYISQWQIVKLSACAKIKILTTKVQTNSNQNQKQINKKPINQKQKQIRCTHLIKKQKYTSDYILNNYTPSNIKIQCPKIYCQDCQQHVNVKSQITKFPFAPLFNKFYGKQFIINDNSSNKIVYQIIIVYGAQKSYIKTSGGVWYEISKQKSSIVSFDKIQAKNGLLFVYQQLLQSNKILRKAQPMKILQIQQQKLFRISQNVPQQESEQQINNLTSLNKNQPQKIKSNSLQNLNQNNQQNKMEQQNEDEPLEDMTKNPLPIVLKKKRTDSKLFKEYKRTVEGLLPKQKEKDAYEKQYDKGKTKKIHKNRQQFRTADFFKLYKDIKNKEPKNAQLNEGDQNQRNNKNEQTRKNNSNIENDDDYNEVYKDRRRERRNNGDFKSRGGFRSRGGFNRSGGNRGDYNKNKDYNNRNNKFGRKFNDKGHNKNYNNKGNFNKNFNKPYRNNNKI